MMRSSLRPPASHSPDGTAKLGPKRLIGGYRGGMRIAASSRIVSPFNIRFSQM